MSKPWDTEPTPITDAAWTRWCEQSHNETGQLEAAIKHAEDLERRLSYAAAQTEYAMQLLDMVMRRLPEQANRVTEQAKQE
jgi:hypothetical protein